MANGKISSLTDDEFISLVKNSFSYSNILTNLGLSPTGGASSKIVKNRIKKLNCNTDHFKILYTKPLTKDKLCDILVEDSSYTNISRLKKRIIEEKVLKYVCVVCNNDGNWMGSPITLQLDHINGIHNDHRVENLRFLCPNCHSQTDTYSGRNKGKYVTSSTGRAPGSKPEGSRFDS